MGFGLSFFIGGGIDCSSPLRRGVWVLGVRAEVACVSVDFVGHISFVFHYWWDGLFVPATTWRFAMDIRRITADRAISTISLEASPFHQLHRAKEYRKKAFVRLKLQENGHPIQYKPLTIQVIPQRLSSFPYSLSY